MTNSGDHRKESAGHRNCHVFAFWWHDSYIQGQNSLSVNMKDKNNPSLWERRQRRNTWWKTPNHDERWPVVRRTNSNRFRDKRNQFLRFPRSGGATSRNGHVPMLPLQTSSFFLFLQAALIPYPLLRENTTIDKRRLVVLISLWPSVTNIYLPIVSNQRVPDFCYVCIFLNSLIITN